MAIPPSGLAQVAIVMWGEKRYVGVAVPALQERRDTLVPLVICRVRDETDSDDLSKQAQDPIVLSFEKHAIIFPQWLLCRQDKAFLQSSGQRSNIDDNFSYIIAMEDDRKTWHLRARLVCHGGRDNECLSSPDSGRTGAAEHFVLGETMGAIGWSRPFGRPAST
jgi:hypothetical protein